MKFGKLQDISNVDFALPSAPSSNEAILARMEQSNEPAQVYVGCTGWSMKEWLGKVYAPGTKAKDFGREYTKQFNTIEFNTTHYRIPSPAMVEKWYIESAPDFKFCPKIPQSISHARDLGFGGGALVQFCETIQGLKEKLGCCFMQLPPYFGVDRLHVLIPFLKNFPSHIPLAIEMRHESWFDNERNLNDLLETLATYNKTAVITDVAGRRDVLHMGLTNTTAMIRFVGNDLHETDYSRISEWVEQLKNWMNKGCKEIYFFTHEPDNILAPEMAAYLVEKIQKETNAVVRGPNFYDENAGQMSLF